MTPLDFISSPIGVVIEISVMGALAFLLVSGGRQKGDLLLVLDRLKPSTDDAGGHSALYFVKRKLARNKEKEISLPDKTVLTVPDDRYQYAETLVIPKKITLKRGVYRLLGKEGGNIVYFAKNLSDTSHQMMDNRHMTIIINRSSLANLARGLGGLLGENLMYIILAVGSGVAVGWILYPEFNHAAPVIEFCTRALNGTVITPGCPP